MNTAICRTLLVFARLRVSSGHCKNPKIMIDRLLFTSEYDNEGRRRFKLNKLKKSLGHSCINVPNTFANRLFNLCWRKQALKLPKPFNFKPLFYSRKSNNLEDSVEVRFSRSSGPGGQNVNKLNTKAEIRLDIGKAEWLDLAVRGKLKEQQKNKINKNGELIITSDKYRTQSRNLKDAICKLKEIIDIASHLPEGPSQDTVSKILERIEKENERRIENKKFQSEKKKNRYKI